MIVSGTYQCRTETDPVDQVAPHGDAGSGGDDGDGWVGCEGAVGVGDFGGADVGVDEPV